jgi:hypothetical protein
MDNTVFNNSPFKGKIQDLVAKANSFRLNRDYPTDLSFAEILQQEHKIGVDELYESLGINPAFDTVENIFTTPDRDVRWLIPEIFRDALRLGYRTSPIWPTITAYEETTSGLSQVLPSINMSDAAPKRVGEGETIPVGTLTFQSKKFDIHKFGRGIKLTDEVARYVNLAVISIYFQDFGMKMGLGVDHLAINTLINGEQADGSESAPVIGVGTPNTLKFRDFLKIWIRMAKIGRMPKIIIGNEDAALETWDLPEFKNKNIGTPDYKLNVKTPLPTGADYFIHGNVGTKQQLILDPTSALIKLNAQPMMIESERIVSNQTEAFYASFTLGFAKLFTDACVIMDYSKDFAAHGFPAGFDIYGPHNQPMVK